MPTGILFFFFFLSLPENPEHDTEADTAVAKYTCHCSLVDKSIVTLSSPLSFTPDVPHCCCCQYNNNNNKLINIKLD